MEKEDNKWDFFISHSGADITDAETLYELLLPHSRVFLSSRCLLPGDRWDKELSKALGRSLITILLVSAKTEDAHYQNEEILLAVDEARKAGAVQRIVPVYIDGPTVTQKPFGLGGVHSLYVSDRADLSETAQMLLNLLSHVVPLSHPQGQDKDRGLIQRCSFTINRSYSMAPYNRWKKFADVLVDFNNPLKTPYVFLIPSGAAPREYGDTFWWRTYPELIAEKAEATERFCKANLGRRLEGGWFPLQRGDRQYATVYSLEYDEFLNKARAEHGR